MGSPLDSAYGIAIYIRRRLHGVLRPSPPSLHRLSHTVLVYVRNCREAELLAGTGTIDPARIIHVDLSDHEQLSLI
ncbi:hypothetical protein [Micromonospora craterilacus]|uniref:hypothetical protein n=1 Tax=Micromonospora craterilacus TaxID=1655439 RepID=UPI0018F383D7|nr:hypothetical protein [Micromonospora craterilacus]